MDIIERIVNGAKYTFECNYQDCRDGFNHYCNLYRNGDFLVTNKVHYINRTWEAYRFQTAMLGAIRAEYAYATRQIRDAFMDENGYKRLTEARREELKKRIDSDEYAQELNALRERVYHDKYGSEEERAELESWDRILKMTEAMAALGAFSNRQ